MPRRSAFRITLILSLLLWGCEKDAGIGGRAEIHGRVMERHHEEDPPYPRPGYRVYIVYGEGEVHHDDVRTGHDGRFRFAWLRKGDYRVFTYTECQPDTVNCPSGVLPVFREVVLKDGSDLVDVGDIEIVNW